MFERRAKLLNEKFKKGYLEKKALKRIKISLLKRINPPSVSLTLKLRFPSREKMNGGNIYSGFWTKKILQPNLT
ncbi:hypothetical protein LEP1GSC191_0627 [Leptospira borgpetersenii serovar Mini str. 201000851]|uniref:Uncharacterized protein n=1 Tax=Leptospira borgpetersenii str. 200801926 TaxID=1193009 RepID=A0ABN0I2S8_LEPBO|nr:hypothetical protein LEP1GSC128_2117 [Leptospira borgpetersenii str. 200801926]ENO64561.1 hypothetical protein LEP1GSC191_0627 [Leptospira borgpetersenii serovar Mini str. 201000851]